MNTRFLLYIIFLSILGCNGQEKKNETKKLKKIEMTTEKFDIETFTKKKNESNEYSFELEDGARVRQIKSGENYIAFTTPLPPEMFMIFKEYFNNGSLKRYIIRYPKNFLKMSKEYNEEGKLIEEIDYDKPYSFTFEELVTLLKKEVAEIDFYDKNTTISRGINSTDWQDKVDKGPTWYVVWKKDWGRRETLKIDGITGQILEKSFYNHLDN